MVSSLGHKNLVKWNERTVETNVDVVSFLEGVVDNVPQMAKVSEKKLYVRV